MSDSLEAELEGLVMNNWALVYDLHRRAEGLKRSWLDGACDLLRNADWLERYGRQGDDVKSSPRTWYLAFPQTGNPYASYVQFDIPTSSSAPEVRVYSNFSKPPGISSAAIKEAAKKHLSDDSEQYGTLDMSGSVTLLERRLPIESSSLDDIARQVAQEVERQAPVAHALWKALSELLLMSRGAPSDGK